MQLAMAGLKLRLRIRTDVHACPWPTDRLPISAPIRHTAHALVIPADLAMQSVLAVHLGESETVSAKE